ncbi:MAG TPA: LamG domain-containing protein [Phycisphaerae bacterium]|nr:LamG domain-containing protein [Phycisphaerae bacterium]
MRTIVIALAVGIMCSTALTAEKDSGLVLHYTFDKSAGNTVRDESGRGNNGEILGGTRWVKGKFGSALEFNGKDGYVDCGAKPSLNIGKAGTIAFWFKPKTTPQGGLVGWTAGVKSSTKKKPSRKLAPSNKPFDRPSQPVAAVARPNQRLVVSLYSQMEDRVDGHHLRQALSLGISDGKNFDQPYRSNQHKAYFPPVDKWLFYTVTFDGRALDIYRNGVHVQTRFQTVVPDTRNVTMLIGKCFGMGGKSDYFKGLIDETRIYNRPLSGQEVYKLYMRDAKGRGKSTAGFGSINITPTIMPRAGRVFADLDYRGLAPTSKNLSITADLLDAKGAVIAKGKIQMLPAWGRAEAIFETAKLPGGKYTVRAAATKGKPASLAVNWPGRAKGWENVKVLNNFCWELLNVSPDGKAKAEYVFTNPRRSWVYFVIEAEGDLTLTVPGAKPEIIHTAKSATLRLPAAPGKQEVMRWMKPGEYRIKLGGEGELKKLVVRSVPILAFHHYPHIGPGTGNDHEYLVEHVLSPYNTILTHDYGPEYNPDQFRQKWALELGRHVYDHIYPATHLEWSKLLKDDTARQQIWDYVAPSGGMDLSKPEYFGVVLDEFTAGNDRIMWTKSFYDEWTETLAKIMEDPKHAGRFVMPFPGYNMFDFEKSTIFLRMFVEHGAPVSEQWYLTERDTEEQAWIYINESAAAIEHRWKKEIPGYTELALKWLSYLRREFWNPGVNFKVHMEMQFEHFATRPEFFGVGGIGAYSSYNCNSEEYVRWVSELCRHYGLEGNTDRLSKDPYESIQISNPDFFDGTKNWTLKPAEKNSMVVKSHKGYGTKQERITYRGWTDTPFLWTKRSAEKPNAFSQEIRNLEAGKLYSVRLWIGDYTDLKAGKLKGKKCAVNIRVEGGDVWDDWYRSKAYTDQSEKSNMFIERGCQVQQLIFRAKGPTATLVISDWESNAKPGGPVGQELMFNNIDVHPYLEP